MEKTKPACKYGAKCYRKSRQHLEAYSHPAEKNESKEPPKKKTKISDFFKDNHAADKKERSDANSVENEENCMKESAMESSSTHVKQPASEFEQPENTDAPPSPEDIKENIKQKFLMQMPEDFYDFWEFCKTLNSKNPTEALHSSLGLVLVGPYDILAGKHKKARHACYLRHWRYYYDPPEFMTIIKGDDQIGFHFGYYRDDPKEMPVFVASNAAKINCTITPRGENIFAAVLWYLEDSMKKKKRDGSLAKLKEILVTTAKRNNYPLEPKTKKMKERDKKVVCKTFHGAGIVVPVDKNDVGYRPVPETPADLKKMFKKIAEAKTEDDHKKAMVPLMEIIMLVQFANDECDYGEGLELGLDLFSYGSDVFHKIILNLLPLAYQLLDRNEYAEIITEHLKDRKLSSDLSIL